MVRVVIAGGGVAGGAAACLLGPEALLIEREPGAHDKVCGEFISAESLPMLARLGIDPAALGATPIHTVRLIHADRMAQSRLPFPAFSLSRRVLDEALLARAAACGAQVLRGHAVRGLAEGEVEVAGHGRLKAPALLLATGKHELRGLRRQPDRKPADLVGLKMYFRLNPAQASELAGHVEVMLFNGGYAGLQMVEAGNANLCLLIEQRRFAEAEHSWEGVQSLLEREQPHLARRLQGAETALERPLSIYRVPYGFVCGGAADPQGVYRLGDQAGVIPSFSGDGISIALHTAFAAAGALGQEGAVHHRRMRRELSGQIARAARIDQLARAAPAAAVLAARMWPGMLRLLAVLTRVGDPAAIRTT